MSALPYIIIGGAVYAILCLFALGLCSMAGEADEDMLETFYRERGES